MTATEFKEARLRMGLNQADMALLMGVHQQGVSRLGSGYEGRKPTKQHVAQVVVLEFVFDIGLLPRLLQAMKAIQQRRIK